MQAPSVCAYCDGKGNSDAGGECGFCEKGVPLDTAADWEATWGRALNAVDALKDPGPCTPDTPCAERNNAHVLLYGECFHV